MRIECKHCHTFIEADVKAKHSETNEYFQTAVHKILSCRVCGKISFSVEFGGPPELDFDGQPTVVFSKPKILYPSDELIVNPSIPDTLGKALSEAIETYRASVYTAAAIMCRRTLDGFCAENGATKKNLAANLKELRDNGTITDQLFEWATALRLSGNEAAHDVSVTFSQEDARDLLDFTVAILDFTYSYKVKFEAFRARRKMKK